MDFLLSGVMTGAPQALVGGAAIGTLLCIEVPRRFANVRVEALGIRQCARSCATIVCGCAPEVLGFTTVLLIGLVLRLRGDTEVMTDPAYQKAWEQIKVEWPILMGADTLLNLQAMLRLLVLLFVGMRAQMSGRSPLSGLPALLFGAAALTRGMLNTRTDAYRLEGPLSLGGDLPVACEVAGVAFWAVLGKNGLKRNPVAAAAMTAGGVWFASHHYLNLAKDAATDQLFIQAHVLELLAAFAYVVRSFYLMVGGEDENAEEDSNDSKPAPKRDWRSNAFVGFMHMVLTLQQAFSAYYFLTAFEPHSSLVGAGRPFCVLCIGNLLALGAFLLSAAFWAGAATETVTQPAEEDAHRPQGSLTITEVPEDEEGAPTATELEESTTEGEEDTEQEAHTEDEVPTQSEDSSEAEQDEQRA